MTGKEGLMKKLISILLAMLLLGTSLLVSADTENSPYGVAQTQEKYADLIATAIAQSEYEEEQIDKEHIFIVEYTSLIPMQKNEEPIWLYVAMPIRGTSDISYAHFDKGEYVMAITNFVAFEGMKSPCDSIVQHYLKTNYLSEPSYITNVWVGERVHVFAYGMISGGLKYIIPYYFTSESSFNVTNDESCQLELGRAYLLDDFITICEKEAQLFSEYRKTQNEKEGSYTYIDHEGEVVTKIPENKEETTPTGKQKEETVENKDSAKIYTFEELTNISAENVEYISITHNDGDREALNIFSSQLILSMIDEFKNMKFTEDTGAGSSGGWLYIVNFYMEDGTYLPFGTKIHIGKTDYKTVDGNAVVERMAYYHDLIRNIDCSDWALDSVLESMERGFLEDVSPLTYKEAISREQFCEIIYNMLMKAGNVENAFAVPAALYFKDSDNHKVSTLYYAGIIRGKGDRVFAPNDSLTREEAATILYRVAEFLKTDMPRNAYSDSIEYYADKDSISSWAFDAVFYMREMGIMEGTGGNQFSPKTAYTVEQAITTVVRLCEK